MNDALGDVIRHRSRRFSVALLAGCAVLLVVLSAPGTARARGDYMGQIPNGEEFGCDTCHLQLPWLTDFGIAVGRTHPRGSVQWWKVADLDSDGDGQTNGFELGDPCGDWVEGDENPARVSDLSHPGFADSMVSPKVFVPDCGSEGDDDDSGVEPVDPNQCGYSFVLASHPVGGHGLLIVLALVTWGARRSRRSISGREVMS